MTEKKPDVPAVNPDTNTVAADGDKAGDANAALGAENTKFVAEAVGATDGDVAVGAGTSVDVPNTTQDLTGDTK